jgi:hypothetical protein
MLQNLVLKVAYLHYSMVLEQIVVLLVDLGLGPISTPFPLARLQILAPSWAIFGVFTHLISTFAWGRYVVLDQIYEILNYPSISNVVIVTSS